MEHQMSKGVPWGIREQQWQQNLQVDLGIQSDTTSPRRHLGCQPSWVWERTGASMAVYPHSTTHLPQGLSAGQRICSNSSNPLNMVAAPYSSASKQITVKLCPTPAFNQIQSSNTWHYEERISINSWMYYWGPCPICGGEQLMYDKSLFGNSNFVTVFSLKMLYSLQIDKSFLKRYNPSLFWHVTNFAYIM